MHLVTPLITSNVQSMSKGRVYLVYILQDQRYLI